jgi:hypothetical protein
MKLIRTLLLLTLGIGLSTRALPSPGSADGSAGGIHWTVPAGWQTGPPQPMRAASYTIPAAPGAEAGGCGVFFFGKGQGGGVEDNLQRWVSQFEGASAPKKSEQKINGLTVHRIDVSGTYLAPSGPNMQSQGKKPGWRLIGAIVEAPDGLVFFKSVGPAATMQKTEPQIEQMLKSIAKAGAAKA